ncbi:protein hold'em isoform X2 [Bradysia coprophila]|uniref:protein hold'em isoform X2 n=1 Tax=Bradysia coprophila TaxID=38358 RepID=UPI00187D7D85|nr:protein hold'em isoform X2 [Bradysia coprophila]
MMSLNTFSIAALHANAINFVITGLIIGKSNVSKFEKIERQDQPSLRGVIKFLIRDNCDHFINVTVWGTYQFVAEYNSHFTIGHVINVIRSKVSFVRHDDTFNPITSSPLELTINEGFGSIEFFDGDVAEKVKLLRVPLKSPDLALNLADIASTSDDAGGLVDLFVLVAKLRPTRQIAGKLVRDVVVVDQTVPGMYLTIWNEAWNIRSDSWNEMSTVLHLINIGYKYSGFHKSIVLATLSRTIIIVDPDCERSKSLKEYGQSSALILTELDYCEPDLSTIKTVMSIQQILNRLNDSSGDSVFYSLTYAMVTQMDIDGWSPFYSRRCIHCNCRIKIKDTSCEKEDCSLFFAESPLDEHYISYFNIPVHLTDHTGTLQCRLVGDAAERIFGCSLTDYLKLSDSQRTSIKWKFLMERCTVKLAIKRKTALRFNTQITIVDLKVANPAEVLEKILVY